VDSSGRMTTTQPAHCPAGEAPDLTTRLPRHCAGCHSYAPPLGCAWPAWSDEERKGLAGYLVRTLHLAPTDAQARVLDMEAGGPRVVQLVCGNDFCNPHCKHIDSSAGVA